MGQYINYTSKGKELPASYQDKIKALMLDGATSVSGNEYVPDMICVMDNGYFAAAGYAYSEKEYQAFAKPDGRPKTWLTHPSAKEMVD